MLPVSGFAGRTQLLQSCRGTGVGDSSEAFILAGYSAASLVLLPGGSPTNCSLAVLKNYFIASFSFELNITSVCGVLPLSCRFLLPWTGCWASKDFECSECSFCPISVTIQLDVLLCALTEEYKRSEMDTFRFDVPGVLFIGRFLMEQAEGGGEFRG